MTSMNILLKLLPQELQDILKTNQLDNVSTYFMSNNIANENLVFYLSNLANQINTIEYHEMAGSIFHFHFNYMEHAYDLAYYHYWQSLELSHFEDEKLINEFLEILGEPDFDMISKEHIKLVANKVLEKDPDNTLAMKYIK
ncbi:hypothetical protein ACUW9N_000953 [Staphylococcus auricularis]|uniref:Genomic island nu Sa alpha2 n=1 Tax=Staphylococcus auricularis TaxID=29379 RepID=A0AAW7MF08_9STAP|nr:hypothetical protein [Staphylococcus auricularis]MBM0868512.1 hypothetical protein [Staphylococcus auricularis]MCG7341741.1 hypothetical protein [Staphylococcus auricularis]MDC6327892.1 hypothetical protein [Staphylococcus auricularis]MDN4533915.1 hypothetical protein [Staphylococcus auricularis]HJE01283.1 hypothetical protein [Staphylococcus auricularis]